MNENISQCDCSILVPLTKIGFGLVQFSNHITKLHIKR